MSGKRPQASGGAIGERGQGIPQLTCVWSRRPGDRVASGNRGGLQIATRLDKAGEIAQIVSEGFVEQQIRGSVPGLPEGALRCRARGSGQARGFTFNKFIECGEAC
jgi:hypothetical protein